MTDPRAVLRRTGLAPKRSFGQNFLVSPHVVAAIADACAGENVIELGAGTGALTRELAKRAKRVVAVERDRDLVPVLREELAEYSHVEIVEGDAAAIDPSALVPEPRILCGNLPYQITGRLVELATIHADALARVVFMVQLEVAERLAAEPGTKAYGALSVFVGAAFEVKKLFEVSPGSFHPPPEVTSAVVQLTPRQPRLAEETDLFRALVKGAFGARRKTLKNAWAKVGPADRVAAAAEAAGIALDRRGETLSVSDYATMARELSAR
jgi:16S rRNA (adenine1518-N6/adenine1519-N6)-dimethyltransferase